MTNSQQKLGKFSVEKSISNKGKVGEIRDFLNENYEIKVNCFDPSRSILESKKKKYDFAPTFDDISLHAFDDGLTVSDTVLRKILRSPNQIRTYNPIKDYFDSLKGKYKGSSHIDILSDHLRARDFGDKKDKNYYQNRINYLLRKWCVAAVAQVLDNRPNDVALGFIYSGEGIGKSYLTQFLTPDPLIDYYKISDKDPKKFSLRDELTKNFIVNYDEVVGLTPRNADDWKAALSGSHFDIKHKGDYYARKMPRMASVLFTSNLNQELGGFIHPAFGYRRFGSIEITEIDRTYSSKVSKDQIWAEALTLYNGDFDFVWNQDDFKDLKEYNNKYFIESHAQKLIALYYECGDDKDNKNQWLQPSEILSDLNRARRITSDMLKKVSAEKIGEALRILGYERKSVRREGGTRYCYFIKEKE